MVTVAVVATAAGTADFVAMLWTEEDSGLAAAKCFVVEAVARCFVVEAGCLV